MAIKATKFRRWLKVFGSVSPAKPIFVVKHTWPDTLIYVASAAS